MQQPQKNLSCKLRGILNRLKMRVLSVILVLVLCVCSGALGVQVKVSISCSWKYCFLVFLSYQWSC